jgi:hypothetical protein
MINSNIWMTPEPGNFHVLHQIIQPSPPGFSGAEVIPKRVNQFKVLGWGIITYNHIKIELLIMHLK